MENKINSTPAASESIASAEKVGDVISLVFLKRDNSRFYRSENSFLMLDFAEKKQRVMLHRAFPFDRPEEFISVLDEKGEEIAIIASLSDFDEETAALLREELAQKYFVYIIQTIKSVKERFGFSFWVCNTDCGEVSFSVQDTFRSIIKITPDRVFVQDVDGCRYEIKSLEALDRKSYHKIELYL